MNRREVTLLGQIESLLISKLKNMLIPHDPYGLKQIEIQPFGGVSDFEELIERFRSRMPGMFLSIPIVDYNSEGSVRAEDLVLNYGLLIGVDVNSRSRTEAKTTNAFYYHERLNNELFYASMRDCSIPTNNDFIRPVRWEYVEVDHFGVSIYNFRVNARNWNARHLEAR